MSNPEITHVSSDTSDEAMFSFVASQAFFPGQKFDVPVKKELRHWVKGKDQICYEVISVNRNNGAVVIMPRIDPRQFAKKNLKVDLNE